VAQAAAQQDLDVGLGGGAVRVVVGVGPLGAVGAAPAAHERAAEEGGLPGQRVAAVAGAGGVEAAQADVDREVRGAGSSARCLKHIIRRAISGDLLVVGAVARRRGRAGCTGVGRSAGASRIDFASPSGTGTSRVGTLRARANGVSTYQ